MLAIHPDMNLSEVDNLTFETGWVNLENILEAYLYQKKTHTIHMITAKKTFMHVQWAEQKCTFTWRKKMASNKSPTPPLTLKTQMVPPLGSTPQKYLFYTQNASKELYPQIYHYCVVSQG